MAALLFARSALSASLVSLVLVACGDDGGGGGGGGSTPPGSGGSDAGIGGQSGASGQAGAGGGAGAGAGGQAGEAGSGGTAGAATGGTGGAGGSGGTGGTLTCLQKLDQLGVPYKLTSAKGVVDAVNLTGKINGLLIASTNTDNLSKDPMGCEFVLHLWTLAEVLGAHGIHKIGTLGAYCYRCCCYWSETNYCRGPNDPEPDCTVSPWKGYSNHSWGRAIDIRWLYKDSGEVWDIKNPAHWVEWSSSSSTCTTALAAQSGISKELYALACELSAKKVFGTILTPNYNDAHRDHWHADIGQQGEPSKWVVLSSEPNVDVSDGPGDE